MSFHCVSIPHTLARDPVGNNLQYARMTDVDVRLSHVFSRFFNVGHTQMRIETISKNANWKTKNIFNGNDTIIRDEVILRNLGMEYFV